MAGTPGATCGAVIMGCGVIIARGNALACARMGEGPKAPAWSARFFSRTPLCSRMPTVLFVCVENTFRSVLSEALFNSRAPPGWHAESAGVSAAKAINPVVVDLLREVGIELRPKTPRAVTPQMIDSAARVVTFGCLDRCPTGTAEKSEDWSVPGATGKSMAELRALRDDLADRISFLIRFLPVSPGGPESP